MLGPCGDLQAVRQALLFDHQGVVTGSPIGVVQAAEDAAVLVMDGGGLAVHHLAGMHDAPAKGLADGLMSQADTQDGDPAGEGLDHLHRNTRLVGGTGPGGDDDLVGLHLLDLSAGDFVIAKYPDFNSQLTKVLHQVVGEGVVVVD